MLYTCLKFWCEKVGGELRKYPAWLVQDYCREDMDMGTYEGRCDEDIKQEVRMNRKPGSFNGEERGLDWWFNHRVRGGLLGETWCPLRLSEYVEPLADCWLAFTKIRAPFLANKITAQKLVNRNCRALGFSLQQPNEVAVSMSL